MKTLPHEIEEMQKAVADPSTWTDERRALKEEVRDLSTRLLVARAHAPTLLAIVRDLAYGKGVTYADKATNARQLLKRLDLCSTAESIIPTGEISAGLTFYPDNY